MTTKVCRTFWLSLAVPVLLTGVASAAGLLIADGGFGGVLKIEEHTVRVTFSNGIVVTEVEQVFRNIESRQVEALYTFPVPEGASVADFTMWIGGREMVGEVVEKERARKIYNSYKLRRQDPGLLEQTDFKTFEMRIFPIGPGAEQRVRLAYYQELDFDDEWATYVYPLMTASRKEIDSRTRGRFDLSLDVTSEVPITAVESPSHPGEFVVVRHSDNYYRASLEIMGADLDRDVVLAFKTERPKTGLDLAVTRQRGEDGYFQLTLTAGHDLEEKAAAMDYVFILDISASMGEDGKLDLSRAAAEAFLDQLDPADRFEVMSFNVSPWTAFRTLRRADPVARDEARDFLRFQHAADGTDLEPALELAYRYKGVDRSRDAERPLNIVILSDGMTGQAEAVTLLRLIGRRPPATSVFCIGVGNEVNRRLLRQIADEAGGLAAFISHGDDFQRQARAIWRQLLRPAGTGLEIDIEGVGAYDVEPATLPNLYPGSPIRIYGRYKKAGTGRVHLQAAVGGERLDQWLELDFPAAEAANPELERMWAWHRVEALQRRAQRQGLRSGVVNEIVRLGEAYSIVTEHTSFLVLENDAEFRRWQIERRNALRLDRDHRAQRQVRERLKELRRGSVAGLGPIAGAATEETKVASSPVPPPPRPARPAPPPPVERHGLDVGAGSGDGGVAVDPASVILAALVLAGLALAANRQRSSDRSRL